MWKEIKESQFASEARGKSVVCGGPMFRSGKYQEYGDNADERFSTHRSQERADGSQQYFRWAS